MFVCSQVVKKTPHDAKTENIYTGRVLIQVCGVSLLLRKLTSSVAKCEVARELGRELAFIFTFDYFNHFTNTNIWVIYSFF